MPRSTNGSATSPGSNKTTFTRAVSIPGSRPSPDEAPAEGAESRTSEAPVSLARTSLALSKPSSSKPSLLDAPATTEIIPVPVALEKQRAYGSEAGVWPAPKDTLKASLGDSGSADYEKSTW